MNIKLSPAQEKALRSNDICWSGRMVGRINTLRSLARLGLASEFVSEGKSYFIRADKGTEWLTANPDHSPERLAVVAAMVLRSLREDAEDGAIPMPEKLNEWSELHDFVDANMYVLNVMPDWTSTDAYYAFTEAAEDMAWLAFKAGA